MNLYNKKIDIYNTLKTKILLLNKSIITIYCRLAGIKYYILRFCFFITFIITFSYKSKSS